MPRLAPVTKTVLPAIVVVLFVDMLISFSEN